MILNGKTVLVTGAGRGLGAEIASRLAANGATVVVSDLSEENASAVAEEIRQKGGRASSYKIDVTSCTEVKETINLILNDVGVIDILVNNAGGSAGLINKLTRFSESEEDTWQWVIDLNLMGTLRCTRAVIGPMLEQGSGKVINISSIAAEVGILDRVDYSAAKGGIVSMTKALALEVGPKGVTVNCISPGLISRSPGTVPSDGTYTGRNGDQKEVASLVSFLASSEADFITGVNYTIDGGRTLGPVYR